VNIGTGKIELTIGHPTDMATQTWANTQLALKANDAAVTTSFAGVQVQLAGKQDSLTASTGIFMNGSTISSYDLRWNTNATPTATIQCLRFEGLSVAETFNLSSGQTELKVEHPAAHPISQITGLQTELNKISGLKTGTSALSMGGGTVAAEHRIAVHEVEIGDPNYTAGTYMYGMGLYVGNTVGTAFWGSTAGALPDQGSGTGASPHLFIKNNAYVGINNVTPLYTLDVTGDIRATGTVYGATKSFDIAHPDPAKPDMRLRHWCTESDEPGGSLIYRKQIDAVHGNSIITMPAWFKHLSTDVLCFASPVRHFGLCWADQDADDANKVILGTSKAGVYNVMITAKRSDICATTMCPQEVEYIPEKPEDPPPPFPPV
jgi:hypothetical protein